MTREFLRYEEAFSPVTAYQLAQAFPEEADLAKSRLRVLKREASFWRDLINDISSSSKTPEQKEIDLSWVEMRMAYDPVIKEINLLEGYLNHIKKPSEETLNVDKAKSIPIQEIIDLGNTKTTRKTISACCPLHKEKTPSFYIYIEENRFKCFGCGKSGDSIQFYMDLFSVDFKSAVRSLAS